MVVTDKSLRLPAAGGFVIVRYSRSSVVTPKLPLRLQPVVHIMAILETPRKVKSTARRALSVTVKVKEL
jgi:hypothetical protein